MSLSTFCRWALQSQNPTEHTKCAGTNCDCDCHRDPTISRGRNRLVCPHPGCVRTFGPSEQRQLANHCGNAHDTRLTDYPPELLDPPEIPANNGARAQEPDVTTIAEHRADTDAPDHQADEPEKQTRIRRTDDQKRAILAALDVATTIEERHAILELHDIKPGSSVPSQWRKELGVGPAPQLASSGRRSPRREGPPEAEAPPAAADQVDDVDETEGEFEICITVSGAERDVLDALGFLDGHGDATGYLVQLVSNLCVDAAGESDVKLVLAARRGRAVEVEA